MKNTDCYYYGYHIGVSYAKKHAKNKQDYCDTVIFEQINYCDFCYTLGFKAGYFDSYDKYYKQYIDANYMPKFSWGEEYDKSKNMFKGMSHSEDCDLKKSKYEMEFNYLDTWNESGYFDD